ncbi:putative methyltransferase FkbM family [Candidatus Nitrososphaera gargensis Ga9.2]|uniref:Putative methyltransferase FkbM family n=1 Tax=Nitrososphaera gargensis (strain Ga9.2) TaxID=1237085 RepID=K0IN20_NITGG|nr:FkbM family methyltransferase [Candidatus Nitrososphaera gargensis]AFU58609.1 putative methyltransferase FkbM family [Candidatus Nitrososphaera gargensis Ga9.2]
MAKGSSGHHYHFLSWLTGEYVEGYVPEIDRAIMFLPKAIFLTSRRSARLLLGQKRRDKIKFLQRFWLADYESPSYHLLRLYHRKNRNKLIKVRVPKYGYSYLCRINSGDYTPSRELEVLQKFTPSSGDVVVDVGAHIGRYTIVSSKAVGPMGRVVAIEADPDNFKILNYNIELNELTNVLPLNYAAYSEDTRLRLYKVTSSEIYNTVMSSRAHSKNAYVDVDACTLNKILHLIGISRVDWIKIDVEGAEFEVIKGATQIMANNPGLSILIEVHNIDDDPQHYDRIKNFLESFGFCVKFELAYSSGERHVIFHR